MNPTSVASGKLFALRHQLQGHHPESFVVLKDGVVEAGIPLGGQKTNQKELATHLAQLSVDLAGCVDDILGMDRRAAALRLNETVGPGPITVGKLGNALEAAQAALNSITYTPPQIEQTGQAEGKALDKLIALVEEVNQARAKKLLEAGYEVLVEPPRGERDVRLKLKTVQPGLATDDRIAKRRGLHTYAADLANQIGCEVLGKENKNDWDDLRHVTLEKALEAFASLGSQGSVSPNQFVSVAQEVLNGASLSKEELPFSEFRDPRFQDEKKANATWMAVWKSDLYKKLFRTASMRETAVVNSVKDFLNELPRHFKTERVVLCMQEFKITPSEALAVWIYSRNSDALNAYCRQVRRNAPHSMPGAEEVIKELTRAMEKLRAPMTDRLLRTIDVAALPASVLEQLTTPGEIFVDEAAVSTSFFQAAFSGRSMTIEVIPLKSDSSGRSIMPLSANAKETEILFPPRTPFLVLSANREVAESPDEPDKWYVEHKELNPRS